MVEAGLTPMQAITNATANAAALLKLDDRGVLASGKFADLVVLEGDPSVAIRGRFMRSGIAARRRRDRSRRSRPEFADCEFKQAGSASIYLWILQQRADVVIE